MKKILALVLSLVLSFSLVACGGGNETDKAKKTAESFMEAAKKIDSTSLNNLVIASKKSANIEKIDVNKLDAQDKLAFDVISKTNYKFVEGEVKQGEDNVALKYEIDGPTVAEIQEHILKEGNLEAMEDIETFMKNFDVNKLESKKREIEIELQKENNEWKISNPESLMNSLVGTL